MVVGGVVIGQRGVSCSGRWWQDVGVVLQGIRREKGRRTTNSRAKDSDRNESKKCACVHRFKVGGKLDQPHTKRTEQEGRCIKQASRSPVRPSNKGSSHGGPLQANYVIREIHMDSCGMHDGPRTVVHKEMSVGYYWPSMHMDANNEIKAWTFRKWGMDIVGPLLEAPEGLEIKVNSTSVYHQQANGAVERANRSIMQGIKTRLHQEGVRLGRRAVKRAMGS
nr:hypothetical protein [Tanacetum cinerariifolium]